MDGALTCGKTNTSTSNSGAIRVAQRPVEGHGLSEVGGSLEAELRVGLQHPRHYHRLSSAGAPNRPHQSFFEPVDPQRGEPKHARIVVDPLGEALSPVAERRCSDRSEQTAQAVGGLAGENGGCLGSSAGPHSLSRHGGMEWTTSRLGW